MNEQEIIEQKQKEYKRGFIDGLTAFAHWRDGVQRVGTSSERPLKQAVEEVEHTWNYLPPTHAEDD